MDFLRKHLDELEGREKPVQAKVKGGFTPRPHLLTSKVRGWISDFFDVRLSFMDMCAAGKAKVEEVDDFIDRWHEKKWTNKSLYRYLGLSKVDYEIYLRSPKYLSFFVIERRKTLAHRWALALRDPLWWFLFISTALTVAWCTV